jgi:PAS domain S-box-containing protein
LGRHAAELAPAVQPDGCSSRERADEYFQLAIAQGRYQYEWLGQRCTGEEFWQEILLTPVQIDGNTLIHAVCRDITPLKIAEQQRLESEDDQVRALRAAGVGTILYTIGTSKIVLDERARAMMGLPPGSDPLPPTTFRNIVHPDDLVLAREALERAEQTNESFVLDFRVSWADSSVHYIRFVGEIEKNGQHQPGRLIGAIRDISAKHQIEQELGYKNRLLEHIVHNLPVVLTRLNHTGVFLELIGLGLRGLDIQDNQLQGTSIFDGFPDETEHIHRLLSGNSISTVSYVVWEGKEVYYQNYGFFDKAKQEAVIFSLDVTESEQIKHKLRAEQTFTKQVLDHSLDALIALDLDLRVTAWNKAATRYTTLAEEKVLGQLFFDLLPQADSVEIRQVLKRVHQGVPGTIYNLPFHNRPGIYDVYFMPLHHFDEDEMMGILMIIRDVTERNRMLVDTVRLQRQQQQVVVQAVFAAQEVERKRIAEALHNGVGQLLYVAKLNLENGTDSDHPPDPAVLRILNEAIQATRNVSHQLTPGILEDFGLQVALQELIKHIPPKALSVHLHLTDLDQPRPLLLDLAIYRIIQELLNNVIKHANAHEVNVQVEHEENQVVLSVQDDGQGIPVTSLPEVDPGMGIMSIRNRAELLGGRFSLESRPGHGTTVRVALPVQAK